MTKQPVSVEKLITARLQELVDQRTPWHRGLWQIGTILQLREVLEYAEGVRSDAMRPEGLDFVCRMATAAVRADRAVGDVAVADAICAVLKKGTEKKGNFDPHQASTLTQLIRRAEAGYLSRWASECDTGTLTPKDVELVSRLVAAHLLDAGFSPDHLHGWLLSSMAKGVPLGTVLLQAQEMWNRDPVDYEVLVPLERCPQEVSAVAGERFLTWAELLTRCDELGVDPPVARGGAGALAFRVREREPKAAIFAVELEMRRFVARTVIGLPSGKVAVSETAIVTNVAKPKWHRLKSRALDIHVASILRHGLLLPQSRDRTNHGLDDAFELLAAVETSTSWASVAAIWAAVEGLLARPGETGAAAADRMAAIVTGSFLRAELTQLRKKLEAVEVETDRPPAEPQSIDRLLDRITNGDDLGLTAPSDLAAVARIEQALQDPLGVAERVVSYLSQTFRRLFQQRNNLLHGGRFDSVALPATMRTAPPLVAAGVDRLVHASMTEAGMDIFGLAARAEAEIQLLGSPAGRPIHQLID